MKYVEDLPAVENIYNDDVFEIMSNNVGYFTHSFFKYPAKFIPQIPRWAIENFSNPKDFVLDCFAGSGTTLVEASLSDRIGLGVDFDEISVLLSKVKCTPLTFNNIETIENLLDDFRLYKKIEKPLPNLRNIRHWFPDENIITLNTLYFFITEKVKDEKLKNFLLVCFISIIRKSSYSEEQSPKPYVSSKYKKEPVDAEDLFYKTVKNYISKINNNEFVLRSIPEFIGRDARNFEDSRYLNKIKLVCASPPYINAFDYVRILRLENVWLRNLNDDTILLHKEKQIGNEQIKSLIYNQPPENIGISELDDKIKELYSIDKKRAHVVNQYFLDMRENIENIYRYLVKGGHYVIVVGDCDIRQINFPVSKFFIEFASKIGYSNTLNFSYIIKNPYLRIPRKKRGGLILYDRVIVLKK